MTVVSASCSSIRAQLRRLYRQVDGFEIDPRNERRIARTRSSSTYGEIMPAATIRMIRELCLSPSDTFVDLGSGVGKVVVAAAIASDVRAAIGVELAKNRHLGAQAVLRTAEAEGLVRPGVVELRNEDMLQTDLTGATVIYTCSTAFPYAFTERVARAVARLRRPLTFVTLQELDELPGFALDRVLRLDMSWARRRKVHVYAVGRG